VRFPIGQGHKESKAYQYTLSEEITGSISPESVQSTAKSDWNRARAEASKYPLDLQRTLLETETPYHHLSVRQNGPLREMSFGKTGYYNPQTMVDMRDIHKFVAEYTHLAFAGLLFRPVPQRVCVIGVGGAVIPRAMERCFPEVQIDCIDIDPEVITVARKYFFWQPSSNVRMYAMDGRSFINWVNANDLPRYDWVILDAFNDNYVPFHLTTSEFFTDVKRALVPDGLLTMNMFIDDDLYGYEARTLHSVFGNVSSFAGHKSGNIELVAQNGRTEPLTLDEAGNALRAVTLPPDSRIDLRYIMTCLVTTQNWSDQGPILTDLWSPVENLVQ
jgi:spermidine synthase